MAPSTALNPLIVRGVAANGIRDFVIESLMARGLDEPFTLYGLIAETVEVPEDRCSITFHLNPKARFSDGKPITADDVLFSFNLLEGEGTAQPSHLLRQGSEGGAAVRSRRALHLRERRRPRDPAHPRADAGAAEAPRSIPTPMRTRASRRPSAPAPTASARSIAGRSITFERDPNYWGSDLPVNRGRFNFDRDPLRLLPRGLGDVRGLQDRPGRPVGRRTIRAAGPTATTSPR